MIVNNMFFIILNTVHCIVVSYTPETIPPYVVVLTNTGVHSYDCVYRKKNKEKKTTRVGNAMDTGDNQSAVVWAREDHCTPRDLCYECKPFVGVVHTP